MTANPETRAYLATLDAYWADAELGLNDGKHMPLPASRDVAMEVAALCSKAVAGLLDFKKTGTFPTSTEPSPASQLEASAIIDAVHEHKDRQ